MIGFLSPDGDFIECESWGHLEKARRICSSTHNKDFRGHMAEDYLMSLGYLVLRARDAYMSYWDDDKNFIFLSKKQLDWLTENASSFNEMQKKDMNEILFDQEGARRRRR